MREIKYRVWDKDGEDYFPIHEGADGLIGITAKGNNILFVEDGEVSTGDAEDYTIEQFTGLKDKNGKDIYEGDIVSKHNSDLKGVVKQVKDGQWAIYWDNTPDGYYVLFKYSNLCEVVGNIHENSELLEK
jgi:hypothetical protein|nr:MAG TPA: YopX protein [Caudoviricetes sp.]